MVDVVWRFVGRFCERRLEVWRSVGLVVMRWLLEL